MVGFSAKRQNRHMDELADFATWDTMIIQPNRWSCLPTALCIIINHMKRREYRSSHMDLEMDEIFYMIGHEGDEIIPELEHLGDPYKRRSFHIQEIIDVAYQLGYALIEIQSRPTSMVELSTISYGSSAFSSPTSHQWNVWSESKSHERYTKYLQSNNAIITGSFPGGKRHAAAWLFDGGYIDPTTGRLMDKEMSIETLYLIKQLRC